MKELVVIILVLILSIAIFHPMLATATMLIIILVCFLTKNEYFADKKQKEITDLGGVEGDDTDIRRGALTGELEREEVEEKVDTPKNEFMNDNDIQELFTESEAASHIDGDQLLSERMQYTIDQSKESMLNRGRFNSDNFKQYFEEELDVEENRHWWEDDSPTMIKDEINYDY